MSGRANRLRHRRQQGQFCLLAVALGAKRPGGGVRAAAAIRRAPGGGVPGIETRQCDGRGQGGVFAFGRPGPVRAVRPFAGRLADPQGGGGGTFHDAVGAGGRARRLFWCRATRSTLLKIDVEGAELGVFKGAERILRQHAPLLVFECENRHLAPGNVGEVFSWLETLGYRGSFICRNRLKPLSQFDAGVHQRPHGEWFWKSRDYCNNFVFAKPPAAGAP